MRDCMDYIELIRARLDGGLTAGQEAELNEHLAACPVCRALAEDMAALHEEMPKLAVEPPADLVENVMARIRAEAPQPIPFPAEQAKRTPDRKWRAWGATAAVLAVVLLGAAALRMGGLDRSAGGAPAGEAPMMAVNDNEAALPSGKAAPMPQPSPSSVLQEPSVFGILPKEGEAVPSLDPAEMPESAAPSDAGGDAPQATEQPRVDSRAEATGREEPPAGLDGESGDLAGGKSGEAPMSVTTALPPEESAPADAAAVLTVMEAADRLYEEQFKQTWPEAERVDREDFQGYVLEPFHLIREEDPESEWTSFGVRFKGKGEGGNYYIFVLYQEYADEQSALERRTWELEHLGVPVSGNGDVLTEPQNIELFDSQDAYDAACSSFWDEVNQ